MAVVDVWEVPVGVRRGYVPVGVHVGLANGIVWPMGMLVMPVMAMGMLVQHRFMDVLMRMALG